MHSHRKIIVRTRWREEPDSWSVRARVERFVEPALLLVLRDGPTHGYDLADELESLVPDASIDLGNLYRHLRALEGEGIVASEWRDDPPGRPKRVYQLTEDGGRLLDAWADALRTMESTIAAFLRRHKRGVKG